jgi:ribosomal protein L12E/L44/L45/RPP1/RPP2
MAILDTIKDMDIDEARSYLQVNGYAPGDIEEIITQWSAAPVAKVVPESRPTPAPRPSPVHIEDEDDEDDE